MKLNLFHSDGERYILKIPSYGVSVVSCWSCGVVVVWVFFCLVVSFCILVDLYFYFINRLYLKLEFLFI